MKQQELFDGSGRTADDLDHVGAPSTSAAGSTRAARLTQGKLVSCGRRGTATLLLALLLTVPGCQKTYYTVLEKVGIEKRELLATRVERAKESQQEAQEEFRDALEKFQAVTGHSGGKLEARYESLRDAYERSSDQASEVTDRIDEVDDVADALFDEWEDELDQYDDPALRRRSRQRLSETRTDVQRLLRVMRKAEASLAPVLDRLRDRVLFLKHNLNAAALTSLDQKVPELERDVEQLVRDMQASITEADHFIQQLE